MLVRVIMKDIVVRVGIGRRLVLLLRSFRVMLVLLTLLLVGGG